MERQDVYRNAASLHPTRADILHRFEENYIQTQYALVQFVSEHLTDCSRSFKGDLVAMLVLAIIGQSHLTALKNGRGAASEQHGAMGAHALRIADVTGIPRETVRRKLAVLQELGWIEHAESGWVLVSAPGGTTNARLDLTDLDRRGLERLARLFSELSRIIGGSADAAK